MAPSIDGRATRMPRATHHQWTEPYPTYGRRFRVGSHRSSACQPVRGYDTIPGPGWTRGGTTTMAVLHRHIPGPDGPRWSDVPVRAYGPENSTARAASRQILIGTDDAAPHFHLRYFRVEPGGHTSL